MKFKNEQLEEGALEKIIGRCRVSGRRQLKFTPRLSYPCTCRAKTSICEHPRYFHSATGDYTLRISELKTRWAAVVKFLEDSAGAAGLYSFQCANQNAGNQ